MATINCPIHGVVDITQEEHDRQVRAHVLDVYDHLLCPLERDASWFRRQDYRIPDRGKQDRRRKDFDPTLEWATHERDAVA